MQRIVATGLGVIAPKIKDVDTFLKVLQNGEDTLHQNFDTMPSGKSTVLGFIDEGLEEFEDKPEYKRFSNAMLLGMKAAKEAVDSSKVELNTKKVGLFVGTALGSVTEDDFVKSLVDFETDHKKLVSHFTALTSHHSITSSIGEYLGIKGVQKTICTGCTSSLEAIEMALLYLKNGIIDLAIVGGVESGNSRQSNVAFMKNRLIPVNQNVDTGAVPFDEESKGFAISDAAAFLILEREDDALERNSEIYGEIEQVHSNNDGIGTFAVDFEGKQLLNIVKECVTIRKPDYVNSQALGIQINDNIEKNISKEVFNHVVPYTSIKSMIGNPFGAVGALQVISGLLSIKEGFIPPTIKTKQRGYEEMLINTSTQYKEVNEVLITNHGHGGNNAVAYLKSFHRK